MKENSLPAPRKLAFAPTAVILVCATALTVIGLMILFSASAYYWKGPYYYLSKQVVGVILSLGICVIVSRINLDYLRQYVKWIGGILVVLLILVRVPGIGIEVNGAHRWLGYPPVVLQVSEFAKLGLVFCLAHYLAVNQSRIGELRRGFLIPLAMIAAGAGLVLIEPDYGTAALMVCVGVTLLFLAGAKWRYVLPAVAGSGLVFAIAVALNPNRLYRFMAFLDVEGNKQGGTYQLYQALAAFAAGGVQGAGLGQGRQQLNFLPEAHTDFIFAVVGEELGLPFTLGVVLVFAGIFIAGLVHLRRAPNLFQFLLATGCLLIISLQAIFNLGVVTGVLPTKGISLPFLSAGLSNLILMGLLLGVIFNTQRTWGRASLPGKPGGLREVES